MLGYDGDTGGDGLMSKLATAEATRSRPQRLALALLGGMGLVVFVAGREGREGRPAAVPVFAVVTPSSQLALEEACPNKAWLQCDGLNFTGVQCCQPDDHCVVRSPEFSQCVPDCLTRTWHQCGGANFTGDACCKPDDHCVARSPEFSQCVPNCANGPHGQCGGKYFKGDGCCSRGFICTAENDFVSSCLPMGQPPASLVALASQVAMAALAKCSTAPWTQCGGDGFKGDSCCPSGYECVVRTSDFSQCAAVS